MPNRATHRYETINGITSAGKLWKLDTTGEIADLSTDFHTYWVTRKSDSIDIGIDNTTFGHWTPSSLSAGDLWVFNQPMYAILNVAVGNGGWIGPPDATSVFPAAMVVDWFKWEPAS